MSRDKQIEEMAKIIRDADYNFVKDRVKSIEHDLIVPPLNRGEYIANALLEHSYRRASEVAMEIFEEIDTLCDRYPTIRTLGGKTFAELRKKYESEGAEDEIDT